MNVVNLRPVMSTPEAAERSTCRKISPIILLLFALGMSSRSALADGFASAPIGTPQFSNLLNGYAVRPDWSVAGVDYYVGAPSGTALKNPATISTSGVSVNAGAHIITVSGSNVMLDGYDFSLNGGWQINIVSGA